MLLRLCALALIPAQLACSPPPNACKQSLIGDSKAAPEAIIGARDEDSRFRLLESDGDPVHLVFPVQGGHVLFVAARVRNIERCGAYLSSWLKDPATGEVAAFEARTIDFVATVGDYAQPDIADTANLANIPACPNYGKRDIVGLDWNLEVEVKDVSGRVARASRRVRPECAQTGSEMRTVCQCECRANYELGRCGRNGGIDGG